MKTVFKIAACAALALGAMAPANAAILFADNFDDNDASDWSITPGSKGSAGFTVSGGILETYFDAPASTGAGFAGVTQTFTLGADVTGVTLALDGRAAACGGCTMRYQALIDGVIIIDGTDLNFTSRIEAVADLAAGLHAITLRHYTDTASSGHFTAFFDNVVLSGTLPTAGAVPEPATWALMIGGFGLAGAGLRRRSTARIAQTA